MRHEYVIHLTCIPFEVRMFLCITVLQTPFFCVTTDVRSIYNYFHGGYFLGCWYQILSGRVLCKLPEMTSIIVAHMPCRIYCEIRLSAMLKWKGHTQVWEMCCVLVAFLSKTSWAIPPPEACGSGGVSSLQWLVVGSQACGLGGVQYLDFCSCILL